MHWNASALVHSFNCDFKKEKRIQGRKETDLSKGTS